MISLRGFFHDDRLQAFLVEQVARELRARARVTVRGNAIARDDALYPKAGSENDNGNNDHEHDDTHSPIVSCLCTVLLLSELTQLIEVEV